MLANQIGLRGATAGFDDLSLPASPTVGANGAEALLASPVPHLHGSGSSSGTHGKAAVVRRPLANGKSSPGDTSTSGSTAHSDCSSQPLSVSKAEAARELYNKFLLLEDNFARQKRSEELRRGEEWSQVPAAAASTEGESTQDASPGRSDVASARIAELEAELRAARTTATSSPDLKADQAAAEPDVPDLRSALAGAGGFTGAPKLALAAATVHAAKLQAELADARAASKVMELETHLRETQTALQTSISDRRAAEARVTVLERELASARSALSAPSPELNSASAQIEKLHLELASARAVLAALNPELSSARTRITSLQAEVKSARAASEAAAAQVADLQMALAESQATLKSVGPELRASLAQVAVLQEELTQTRASHEAAFADKSAALQQALEQLSNLKTQLAAARTARQTSLTERDAAVQQASELAAELALAQAQHSMASEERDAARQQLSELRAECARFANVQAELQARGSALAAATASVAALQAELQAVGDASQDAAANIAGLKDELKGVRAELDASDADRRAAVSKVAALEAEAKEARAALAAANPALDAATAQVARLQTQHASLLEELEQAWASARAPKQELDAATAQIASLKTELSSVQAVLRTLKPRAEAATARNVELQAELSDARAAMSQAKQHAAALETEVALLSSELTAANTSFSRVQCEAGVAKQEAADAAQALERAERAHKDRAAQAEARISSLEGELLRVSQELAHSFENASGAVHEAELAELRQEVERLRADCNSRDSDLGACKTEIALLKADAAQAAEALAAAREELQSKRSAVARQISSANHESYEIMAESQDAAVELEQLQTALRESQTRESFLRAQVNGTMRDDAVLAHPLYLQAASENETLKARVATLAKDLERMQMDAGYLTITQLSGPLFSGQRLASGQLRTVDTHAPSRSLSAGSSGQTGSALEGVFFGPRGIPPTPELSEGADPHSSEIFGAPRNQSYSGNTLELGGTAAEGGSGPMANGAYHSGTEKGRSLAANEHPACGGSCEQSASPDSWAGIPVPETLTQALEQIVLLQDERRRLNERISEMGATLRARDAVNVAQEAVVHLQKVSKEKAALQEGMDELGDILDDALADEASCEDELEHFKHKYKEAKALNLELRRALHEAHLRAQRVVNAPPPPSAPQAAAPVEQAKQPSAAAADDSVLQELSAKVIEWQARHQETEAALIAANVGKAEMVTELDRLNLVIKSLMAHVQNNRSLELARSGSLGSGSLLSRTFSGRRL